MQPASAKSRVATFWTRVEKTGNCWIWTGRTLPTGYGRFWLTGREVYSHRFAWEMAHGAIPVGMSVCHTCDNPSCVRSDHLFLGTQKDNMADAKAKGRIRNQNSDKEQCRYGHQFTAENTFVDKRGSRRCRTCMRRQVREWRTAA